MSSETLGDIGEAGLLERLRRRFGASRSLRQCGVALGVGDDAALLAALRGAAVVSTDMLIEGVDFDFAWATPADVGCKAAAVNLSDMAAMGAEPRALVVSLALRTHDPVDGVLSLLDHLHRTGDAYGAPVVGGDLSSTRGPMVVSVTAIGQVPIRRALRRNLAQPGDVVMVSGALGGAAAGLVLLSTGRRKSGALVTQQLRPTPRVALGRALASWGKVRACADVSDGLARDAGHLTSEGCGVRLRAADVPMARGLRGAAHVCGVDPMQWALSGGEDFELVIAVSPRYVGDARAVAAAVGERLTPVGSIVPGRGVFVQGLSAASVSSGFDHFGCTGSKQTIRSS